MSNFTSLQVLAYRMPTFSALASKSFAPDSGSRIGQGLDAPAQALMQRFAAVLNYAKGLPGVDAKTTTLKVFVAPEFYFKGVGGEHWGSFTFNTMINMLAALKEIGAPGPDWVVVAGTIVFYLPTTAGYKHANGTDVKPTECVYANVAPVITQGGLTYVLKHFISNIDYLPKPEWLELDSIWESDVFSSCLKDWTEQKSRFIAVGNRTIGLEVCLDHAEHQLADAIDEYAVQEKRAAPLIDLHLITSCGMTIKTPLARRNGYVVLCDGQGRGKDGGSQLNKVADKTLADQIKPTIEPLTGALLASSTQTKPPQSIAVYPPQVLPA